MKNIYLASPFFTEAQSKREKLVFDSLNKNNTVNNVFRPSAPEYEESFGTDEWKHKVYESDILGIKNSDIVVSIANFQCINNEIILDSGTAVEIGYAKALGKPILLIYFVEDNKTNDKILNVMVDLSTDYQFSGNFNEVDTFLKDFNFDNFIVNRLKWKTT